MTSSAQFDFDEAVIRVIVAGEKRKRKPKTRATAPVAINIVMRHLLDKI